MIEASGLTRRFGTSTAVADVSFRAEPGRVTGFLGPNGAGKTTTLRLLATFLPPTSGTARVAGFDVRTQPLEVRRRIGYLCEGAPLPPELRVAEYLEIRAALKGLDRGGARRAVAGVVARFELGSAERRLIGRLSRGFRQRVGLADAFLGDPPVLILDEPTVSLDPEQAAAFRELLRESAAERTVFVSTHLLPEAERVCDSLVIVSAGRVVAQGTPETIAEAHGGSARRTLVLGRPAGVSAEVEPLLRSIPGVRAVRAPAAAGGGESWELEPEPGAEPLPAAVRAAVEAGFEVREASAARPALERAFLALTGGGER